LADNQSQQDKGRPLTAGELEELRDGQSLYEVTQTAGWQVLKRWLEDRTYHSWIDPREADSEKEWMWRELNAFHSSDVAKQILLDIERAVERADYLDKVKKGLIQEKPMRI